MLFIGGTRDGQRRYVGFGNGNRVLKLAVEENRIFKGLDDKASHVWKAETYIRKEIQKRGQPTFSVMVKDGSQKLLDAYSVGYNKMAKD